jgi:predicted enzyme related to lactoylglutathione lyase
MRYRALLAIIPVLLVLGGCSPNEVTPPDKDKPPIEVTPITRSPTGEHYPGKFVWHDLLTDDLGSARKFYGGLFGWTFETQGGYTVISREGVPIAGMAKIRPGQDISSLWLPYVSVDDVDQRVTRAKQAGAKLLKGPGEMTSRGRYALIGDPDGALLMLLKSSSGDPKPTPAVINGWLWDELWTVDVDKALGFYQGIGDYQPLNAAGGNPDEYRVLTVDGKWAAGITTRPFEKMNAQWIPAVRIDDLGKLMQRVEELGGRVLIEPDHSLAKGNIALIQDPSGAILMVAPEPDQEPGPDPGQKPSGDDVAAVGGEKR